MSSCNLEKALKVEYVGLWPRMKKLLDGGRMHIQKKPPHMAQLRHFSGKYFDDEDRDKMASFAEINEAKLRVLYDDKELSQGIGEERDILDLSQEGTGEKQDILDLIIRFHDILEIAKAVQSGREKKEGFEIPGKSKKDSEKLFKMFVPDNDEWDNVDGS